MTAASDSPFTRRALTCRHGRPLSYVEAGTGEPALAIANAYGVSVDLWAPAIARLAEGRRVIAWDTRGFADGEADLDFRLDDHAEDLREILDHAGAARVDLLAYCSGTKVALETYSRMPGRVRALAFVGGNFWPMAGAGPMNCRFAENLYKLARMVKGRPIMAPLVVRVMRGNGGGLPMVAENLAAISEEYRDLVTAPFASKDAVLTYADLVVDYYERDATAYLDAIDAPTLVIGARRDVIVDPELSVRAAERIPGASYVAAPDFNHFCMIEAPDALADLVAGFLDRVGAAPAAPEPPAPAAPSGETADAR